MSSKNKSQTFKFIPVLTIGVLVISIGSVFYHHVEQLKWLDSIYFSVITITTVGYGDITPHTDAGKVFTIFYVLIGFGIIAGIANILLHGAVNHRLEKRDKK